MPAEALEKRQHNGVEPTTAYDAAVRPGAAVLPPPGSNAFTLASATQLAKTDHLCKAGGPIATV